MVGIEDVIGVTDHPHHVEVAKQLVLLLLGQRAALGDAGQARDDALVAFVFALLLGAQGDEVVAVGAFGQLGLHVGFASAKHVGLDAFMELVEVAITGGTATVVEVVVVAVKPEQRTQQGRVEEVHQRIQLVNAVLDGRAGEDESVTAAQALDGLGGLGAPVLDPLRFVQHDDVGPQPVVDLQRVGEHLLIIDDGEERLYGRRLACPAVAGRFVSLQPSHPVPEHKLIRQIGKPLYLLLPLGFQ